MSVDWTDWIAPYKNQSSYYTMLYEKRSQTLKTHDLCLQMSFSKEFQSSYIMLSHSSKKTNFALLLVFCFVQNNLTNFDKYGCEHLRRYTLDHWVFICDKDSTIQDLTNVNNDKWHLKLVTQQIQRTLFLIPHDEFMKNKKLLSLEQHP